MMNFIVGVSANQYSEAERNTNTGNGKCVCPHSLYSPNPNYSMQRHAHTHATAVAAAPQCAQTNRLSLRSDNKRPYASRYNDFWLLYCCSIQLPFRYLNFSCCHCSACLLALSLSFSLTRSLNVFIIATYRFP